MRAFCHFTVFTFHQRNSIYFDATEHRFLNCFLLVWRCIQRLSKRERDSSHRLEYILFFRWGNFYDPESELSHYEICLGKSQGECDEIDYIFVGLNTTYEFNDLKLYHKEEYYVTIKINNMVGLSTQMTSSGVQIDRTPPKPVKHISESSSNEVSFSGAQFFIIPMFTFS